VVYENPSVILLAASEANRYTSKIDFVILALANFAFWIEIVRNFTADFP
jgi:hypothetical protein